jgi:hypothetical protein
MRLGPMYMIQRPKNNPRNGDTVVPHIQRSLRQKSSSKMLASIFWDKDGILLVPHRLPEKGCNHRGKVLCMLHFSTNWSSNWSPNVKANFRKESLFLQDDDAPHKAAITHQKLADLHFEVLKHPPTYLIWPLRTTASFRTPRNNSTEESFRALRRPH